MRKHFYLVTSHPDDDLVGNVITTDKRKMTTAEKNKEGVCQKRDLETNETWSFHEVGLGYYDFEDEDDYQENAWDVIHQKLGEVDESHLEKAGLDPSEVLA